MRLTQHQRRQLAQHRARRAVRAFLYRAEQRAAWERLIASGRRWEAEPGCVVLTYDPGANWLADVNRFLGAESPSARTH